MASININMTQLTQKERTALQRRFPPLISWWVTHIINLHPQLDEQQLTTARQLLQLSTEQKKQHMVFQDQLVELPKTEVHHVKQSKNYSIR